MITLEKYAALIGYNGYLDLNEIKDWAYDNFNWKIQDKENEEDITVENYCKVSINGEIRYLGI